MRLLCILIAAIALTGVFTASGQGIIFLDSPQDDASARADVENTHPHLEAPRKAYNKLIGCFEMLTPSQVRQVFGRRLAARPKSAVRAIFAPRAYSLPGIVSEPIHDEFYAVGDLAFADVFFLGKQQVVTTVLYFRADQSFVPLHSAGDYRKRLRWDLQRLRQVQQWLTTHVPAATHPLAT